MSLISMEFLTFVAVAVIGYYLIPKKYQWIWLLAFSYIYYASSGMKYLVFLLYTTVVTYGIARMIYGADQKFAKQKEKIKTYKKSIMVLALLLDFGMLAVLKYTNFAISNVNTLFHADIRMVKFLLPLGISFYTFQALSYVVDVYRGENQAQKNPLNMMLYISFFPQLIAGPIVKYHDIEEQIENRTVTLEGFSYGVKRFIFGLGKKVILANTFAEVVDAVYAYQAADVSQAMLWLTALLYMLQIYFDFSGYSDMAIGLGKMFGFTFIENFRLPYTATSIQDFWRKWHISLSSWFKEYVYIPLGGNRRGTARTYVNLWTVFLLTGIWHGAGWTFIFWGIYHGFFNVLERCFLGKWLKQEKFRPLAHIYAVFVVLIGWIFFRADTIGQAFSFIRYMFVPHSAVVLMERYMNRKLWMFLAAALLACGPVQWFWMKWKGRVLAQDGSVTVTSWIGYMAILWFSILLLVNNTYNPFIYFRF